MRNYLDLHSASRGILYAIGRDTGRAHAECHSAAVTVMHLIDTGEITLAESADYYLANLRLARMYAEDEGVDPFEVDALRRVLSALGTQGEC